VLRADRDEPSDCLELAASSSVGCGCVAGKNQSNLPSASPEAQYEGMDRVAIELKGLTVCYGPKTAASAFALNRVGLRVATGEVVGILGESGSGKSTLAAAIMRLLPATAECHGQILFENRDLMTMGTAELQRIRGKYISLVPQDPATSLNPVIRIDTQISEVLRAHVQLDHSKRKKCVRGLLQEMDFDDQARIASSYPHQLSGGERQRVVIAQAIACRPALVIADEAISKLDAPLQMQIQSLMSAIVRRQGTALIWITHDPATLVGFADRIVVMQAGKIVEQAATVDLFRSPAHPYTRRLVDLARGFAVGSSSAPLAQYAH
jgi:ABC-type glutathione transport system ATPase component